MNFVFCTIYVVKDLFVIFLSVEVTCIVTEIGMLWTWLYLLLMVLCPVLWARFLLFGWVSCVQAELASFWWPQGLNPLNIVSVNNNNNNEYLECLACTGPKHFHILFTYTLSKFDTYNMNTPHTRMHIHAHTPAHTHAHTQHTCTHPHNTNVHAHTHGHISGQLNVKNPTPKTTELWKTTYWWYLGSSLLFLHSFHCTAAVHICLLCYFNKWCRHCTV